jgi:hypothetical protein
MGRTGIGWLIGKVSITTSGELKQRTDDVEDEGISGSILAQITERAGTMRGGTSKENRGGHWNPQEMVAGSWVLQKKAEGEPWPEPSIGQVSCHVISCGWAFLLGDVLDHIGDQYLQVGSGRKDRDGIPVYEKALQCKKTAGKRQLDKGYPKYTWNAQARTGTLVYEATFPTGSVKTGGIINELCVRSGWNLNGRCLAYGWLVPGVVLRKGDEVRIRVELTSVPEAGIVYER